MRPPGASFGGRFRVQNARPTATQNTPPTHPPTQPQNTHLRLAEPHREQLRPLDRDEVRLALVGNRLGQERLPAAGRPVEEHALGRRHAKLLKLLGVLDRVLDRLLELALDALEPADVVPGHVGHLDDRLAQRRGVAHAERWAQTNVDSLLGKTITNYVDLDSFKMINGFGYYKTKTTITDHSSGESSTKISSLEMEFIRW